MRRVRVLTTGGTIEKVYDEATGTLENRGSIIARMLGELRLEAVEVAVRPVLAKDSLLMTDDDRALVLAAARDAQGESDGVVILHGTDTLARTGELIHASLAAPRVPIVLTGARGPFEMKRSDALQNLTEAIFAAGVLPPGVYCVAHGQALRFPGVTKDQGRLAFVRRGD